MFFHVLVIAPSRRWIAFLAAPSSVLVGTVESMAIAACDTIDEGAAVGAVDATTTMVLLGALICDDS